MKNIYLFIKFSMKYSKKFIILIILNSLIASLFSIFTIYSPKILIDSINTNKELKDIYVIAVIIILANFLFVIFTKYLKEACNVLGSHVSNMYHFMLGEKVLSIEYKYLEDPYYLDLKERALFACNNQSAIRRIVLMLSKVIENIITILGLVVILSQLGIWLLLIISVAVSINALIVFKSAKYSNNLYQDMIPINRKFGYYTQVISNTSNGKDFRLLDGTKLIWSKFDDFQGQVANKLYDLFKKLGIYYSLMDIVSSFQSFAVYLYVTYRVIKDKLSIGSFSLYVSSAISFSISIKNIINSLSELWQVSSYVKPFIELLSIEDESVCGKIILNEEIQEIEFKHVTFIYPKQDKIILDDISFKINKNEKISIVGLNGAGKTTLIKLICRLYKPTIGEININGININDYEINSYNDKIACVFQDFKLFSYSIKDNITGNYNKGKDLDKIIKEVGLNRKLSELKNGINSFIDKSLDDEGIEVSGGENQKIAIARAIYKDASLVILDEPTSALDPLAEADIYENFNNMIGKKMAIYISHRMSSSVFCDKVLVIDGGKISAFDTHKGLMKNEGSLYYKLFTSQANNYKY